METVKKRNKEKLTGHIVLFRCSFIPAAGDVSSVQGVFLWWSDKRFLFFCSHVVTRAKIYCDR